MPTDRLAIILMSPRVPENVGAAARVMKNFGLVDLRVVAARDWDQARAERLARDGLELLQRARWCSSLPEALADLSFVAGTSARQGEGRADISCDPPEGVRRALAATAGGGKAGLLFGPEEAGLQNRDLDLCQALVTIPTNPEFPSLNLAQAVAVMCWEAARGAAPAARHQAQPPAHPQPPATVEQLEGFFVDARDLLLEAGFLNAQNPDAVLLHLRKLLNRANADAREVATLRGLVRQVRWWGRNGGRSRGDDA